jgi:hypothetical protein
VSAASITISGRVFNAVSNEGYSGVALDTCGYGVVTTDYAGNWQLSIPNGVAYCVRIYGSAPSDVTGPSTPGNTRIDGNVTSSYENQISGIDCSQQTSCTSDQQYWDRSTDSGLDFTYKTGIVAGTSTVAVPAKPMLRIVTIGIPHMSAAIMISVGVCSSFILLGILIALISPLRRGRKQSYAEYIRAKYYNL